MHASLSPLSLLNTHINLFSFSTRPPPTGRRPPPPGEPGRRGRRPLLLPSSSLSSSFLLLTTIITFTIKLTITTFIILSTPTPPPHGPPPPAAVPARWPRTPHPAPRSNAATAAACAQPRARATTAAGDRRRPARTTPAWPPRLGAPPGCPTWQPPSSPTRTIGYSCISHEIPSTRARAKSRIGAPSQRFRADFLVNPTVGSAISLLRRNLVSWSRLRQLVTSPSQLRFVHRQFWCIAGYQASISSY
ncbi:putative formin-like protein 18 isoform X2 [Iris pallida]|uniref:Formin-like protein 18 isoform X2 n=1 Tax=Iris pallida TaxID=29817 RepID=A0AAX6HRE8_IRIPA|nr:putative formin-like protein 18 isoform X2 [Iris pallida]